MSAHFANLQRGLYRAVYPGNRTALIRYDPSQRDWAIIIDGVLRERKRRLKTAKLCAELLMATEPKGADASSASFPKRCTKCWRIHDQSSWSALKKIGLQPVVAGENPVAEPPYTLELRNCQCGTTLSVQLA